MYQNELQATEELRTSLIGETPMPKGTEMYQKTPHKCLNDENRNGESVNWY